MTEQGTVLRQLVMGDVGLAPAVGTWTDGELVSAARGQQLVLTHQAVARAIQIYIDGEVGQADVQLWASIVRTGMIQREGHAPVTPIEIEYEPTYERAIVDAVGRLDELGDIIDGEIKLAEARELLQRLHDRDA